MRTIFVVLFLVFALSISSAIDDEEEFVGEQTVTAPKATQQAPTSTPTTTPTQTSKSQAQPLSIFVEHSFDGKKFTDRGVIKSSGRNVFFQEQDWSAENSQLFEELTKKDGFYKIRARTSSGNYSLSSVRACRLVDSDFSEVITLHRDNAGGFLHMDYLTEQAKSTVLLREPHTSCHKEYQSGGGLKGRHPKTNVKIQTLSESSRAVVEPKTVIPDPAQPGATPQAEQSFFGKYWYFIVPALVMMVINSVLATVEQPQAAGAPAAGARPAAVRR